MVDLMQLQMYLELTEGSWLRRNKIIMALVTVTCFLNLLQVLKFQQGVLKKDSLFSLFSNNESNFSLVYTPQGILSRALHFRRQLARNSWKHFFFQQGIQWSQDNFDMSNCHVVNCNSFPMAKHICEKKCAIYFQPGHSYTMP